MGWFWKSGLLLFLIGLILQNLAFQKENSEKLVENTADIKIVSESSQRLVQSIQQTRKDLSGVTKQMNTLTALGTANTKDIQYLRRDVDHLIKKEGS